MRCPVIWNPCSSGAFRRAEELDNRWIITAMQRFSARLEGAPGTKGHPRRSDSQPWGAEQTGLASRGGNAWVAFWEPDRNWWEGGGRCGLLTRACSLEGRRRVRLGGSPGLPDSDTRRLRAQHPAWGFGQPRRVPRGGSNSVTPAW